MSHNRYQPPDDIAWSKHINPTELAPGVCVCVCVGDK